MAAGANITDADARMIMDAALFAAHAHSGQIRDDKGDPYINHLAEVAAMCASIEPFDPVLVTAAWLHDTVEDTGMSEADIGSRFGGEVAALVLDVTDPPGLHGDTRRERQITHTAASSPRVRRLKLADKTSNVEELIGLPQARFDGPGNARYLDWSRRVVAVCRGLEPDLEARFDRSAARLDAEIATARQRDAAA